MSRKKKEAAVAASKTKSVQERGGRTETQPSGMVRVRPTDPVPRAVQMALTQGRGGPVRWK